MNKFTKENTIIFLLFFLIIIVMYLSWICIRLMEVNHDLFLLYMY